MPDRKRQRTLAAPARVRGHGVHTGEKCSVTIRPAEENHGIVFRRADLDSKPLIPATHESIVWAKLHNRTTLAAGDAEIQTPEHLLSALVGMGVDNALIDVNGPEIPGGDNSALPFVEAMEEAGFSEQAAPLDFVRIDAPVCVRDEESGAEVTAMPSDRFEVTFFAEFPEGYFLEPQTVHLHVFSKAYREKIAAARTWIFAEQIPGLLLRGLGKGGTKESVLVIGKSEFVTEPRMKDEPARHKALDLIGDLALIGRPLHAHVMARRSGHALHAKLVQQIVTRGI